MTNNPENPLAERLREARRVRMTQAELSTALKWANSKISKIESGRQLPSPDDLAAWAAATGRSTELPSWLAMLDQARAQHQLFTESLRAGQALTQMDFQELVHASTNFRFYEKTYIPLFLQTPALTRANLAQVKAIYQPDDDPELPAARRDLERAVAARQGSAARLYDPDCQFQFLIDEAVLRRWRYSPEIWRDQLIRVGAAVDLSNVELGILPLNAMTGVFDSNSFEIFGDVVSIEASHGELRYVDNEIVEHYNGQMDWLWSEAVTGAAAIELIEGARRAIPQ